MEQRGHSTKLFPPKLVQSIISSAKNRMVEPDELAAADRPSTGRPRTAADIYRALARR